MFLDGTYLILFDACPVSVGDQEKRLNFWGDVENEVNLYHLYQSSKLDFFLKRNFKGKPNFHQLLSILSNLARTFSDLIQQLFEKMILSIKWNIIVLDKPDQDWHMRVWRKNIGKNIRFPLFGWIFKDVEAFDEKWCFFKVMISEEIMNDFIDTLMPDFLEMEAQFV